MNVEQDRCECCGQIKPTASPVQVDLTENRLTYEGQTIKLSSRLASFAFVLARRMPATVSMDLIARGVWGDAEPEGSTEDNIRVIVSHLRPHLKAIGLYVFNTHSVGYRLDVLPAVSRTETSFRARGAQKGEHSAQA